MTHAHSTVTASIFVLALVSGAGDIRAQERGAEDPGDGGQEIAAPVASHGGRVELVPGAPVQEDDDPVNRLVASETVDGLLLSITLDGATASLDSAVLARIPKRLARPDRQVHGDAVEVRGLIDGQEATRTTVPDNLVNASEGDGLVRKEDSWLGREVVVVNTGQEAVDHLAGRPHELCPELRRRTWWCVSARKVSEGCTNVGLAVAARTGGLVSAELRFHFGSKDPCNIGPEEAS